MPKPITKTPWATTYQDQSVTLPDNSPGLAPNKTQAPLSIQDSGVLYHEPLASNWLNFQLDETYQWIDYFETTTDGNITAIAGLQSQIDDIYPTPPAGFTAVQYNALDDITSLASYDIAAQTNGLNQQVGPTGSGAGGIWTAMDSLPADTKFVRLRVTSNLVTPNTTETISVYLGQSLSWTSSEVVTRMQINANGSNGSKNSTVEVDVVLDSSLRFRAEWDDTFGVAITQFNSDIFLIGYGREV
jgi:hypothetical protein